MILAYPPSPAPFSFPLLLFFSSPLLQPGLQERAFIRVTRARVGTRYIDTHTHTHTQIHTETDREHR